MTQLVSPVPVADGDDSELSWSIPTGRGLVGGGGGVLGQRALECVWPEGGFAFCRKALGRHIVEVFACGLHELIN